MGGMGSHLPPRGTQRLACGALNAAMAMVLDAVSRWRKVEEATSSSDNTPPIYLLDELAQLAVSSAEQAENIADHVNKRLQQQSPVVKWKVGQVPQSS